MNPFQSFMFGSLMGQAVKEAEYQNKQEEKFDTEGGSILGLIWEGIVKLKWILAIIGLVILKLLLTSTKTA